MNPPFSKFPSYRSFQEDVLSRVRASRKKVVFINGPPGTGKSLIGMSLAYDHQRSIYLATTKPLQEQLIKDFPEPEAIMLQGRANYPCIVSKFTEAQFPEVSCEDCLSDEEGAGISCKRRCLYQLQKKRALGAGIAILNTAYYLTETNFVGRFRDWSLVVVDECDLLEKAILSFVEINISDKFLARLKLEPPEYKTKWESWKEWAYPVYAKLTEEVVRLSAVTKPTSSRDELRYFRRVKALQSKVNIFATLLDESWIYQEMKGYRGAINYSFKPTWISEIAKQYFWDSANKFVLMSGTPPLPKVLGLEQSEWDWVEVPNQFPPERRPVFYAGIANLTAKTMEVERPKVIPIIKHILSKYPDSKGLIHTVSYALADYITGNINNGRLISHETGVGRREELLKKFRKAPLPLVMVSPSMDRGVDLPYDLCRFIIIVKVPYPDLGDKQTAKRLYSSAFGQYWYRSETARSIIQMSMRGMRNADDQCDTWILDSQFENFYTKTNELFPDWWKKSLEVVEIV